MTNAESLKDAMGIFKGMTPHAIADELARRQIKGRPGTVGRCPLAMHFCAVNHGYFAVGKKFVERRVGDDIERVPTPPNLAEFIQKFDVGAYPKLMAPPPRMMEAKDKLKRVRVDLRRGESRHRKVKAKRVVRHHIYAMIGGR